MLKIYNTLTRKKETLEPIQAGKVGLYSCGPTVYDHQHIGNMRYKIFVDTLRRTLEYLGLHVNHIENITDVGHLVGDENDTGEDKMEKGARKYGMSAWQLAERFTALYQSDLDKLGVLPPHKWVKATDHIAEQISFIKKLEEKGFTYQIDDGIYFDTSKLSDYGKLAKLDIKGLKEGARVEGTKERKNPTDFALWKFHKGDGKRDMEWDSPWGIGFPGWHIECSAMSTKYLGEKFDIHTGGIEHIPVHHTNEIAQNKGALGHGAVNYWVHQEHLLIHSEKMSKSLGNIYVLDDLVQKGYEPMAFRYLMLGTNYRKRLNFTFDSLDGAGKAYAKLVRALARYVVEARESSSKKAGHLHEKSAAEVQDALSDDLNTAKVLSVVWNLIKDSELSAADKLTSIFHFDQVLGLSLEDRVYKEVHNQEMIPEEVHKLSEEREIARAERDFARADELRNKINNLGYFVEDLEDGPCLTKK